MHNLAVITEHDVMLILLFQRLAVTLLPLSTSFEYFAFKDEQDVSFHT